MRSVADQRREVVPSSKSAKSHGGTQRIADAEEFRTVSDIPIKQKARTGTKIAPKQMLSTIVVIERSVLFQECLTEMLAKMADAHVSAFSSPEAWLEVCNGWNPSVILLSGVGGPFDRETLGQISVIVQGSGGVPVVVLSESEEPEHIISALERGARGYIPSSMPLVIAVQALRLVIEGGVFVPAGSLMAACGHAHTDVNEHERFSTRQAAVIEALCCGKPNKIIAHELNMSESTVKVHVRNIMKKLNAKNRTEVAVMLSGAADWN